MIDLKDLMLREPSLTLATAESVTCGRIQARVGLVSGASSFFLGGITAYTLEEKVRHLGVSREEALAVDCVSEEIACQMAVGACSLFGARIGIATTGYAEPDSRRVQPEPFAWWSLAHDLGDGRFALQAGMVECPGMKRAAAQEAIAIAATGALLRYLRQLRAQPSPA